MLATSAAFSENDVLTADDVEIPIEIHPAEGEVVAIWLPSEAGPQAVEEILATELANLGIEVWRVDPVEARFLPILASSLDKIPAGDIQALLEHAHQRTGKDGPEYTQVSPEKVNNKKREDSSEYGCCKSTAA